HQRGQDPLGGGRAGPADRAAVGRGVRADGARADGLRRLRDAHPGRPAWRAGVGARGEARGGDGGAPDVAGGGPAPAPASAVPEPGVGCRGVACVGHRGVRQAQRGDEPVGGGGVGLTCRVAGRSGAGRVELRPGHRGRGRAGRGGGGDEQAGRTDRGASGAAGRAVGGRASGADAGGADSGRG
ncbi:hypothetical protein STAWA0001_0357, partial [Staphylococcus warneri L37603]